MTGLHVHVIGFAKRQGRPLERQNLDTWTLGVPGAAERLSRVFARLLRGAAHEIPSAANKEGDVEYIHAICSVSRKTHSHLEVLEWLTAIRDDCDRWIDSLMGHDSKDDGALCIDDEIRACPEAPNPETLAF